MTTRKQLLADRWRKDSDFAEKVKDRDPRKDAQARELVAQMQFLRETFPGRYTHLVEIGSGDGRMLDFLSRTEDLDMIGSDLAGHRLTRAMSDYPHLEFHEADLISMARQFARPHTIFFAMNVLGNIIEDDLEVFLRILHRRGSALVFSARDLSLDTDMLYLDKGMAFAYNYKALMRRTNMTFFASLHRYRESGNQQGGLVATVVKKRQMKGSRVAELHGRRLKKPLTLRVWLYRLRAKLLRRS